MIIHRCGYIIIILLLGIVFESRLYYTTRDYLSVDIVSDRGTCYLFIVIFFSHLNNINNYRPSKRVPVIPLIPLIPHKTIITQSNIQIVTAFKPLHTFCTVVVTSMTRVLPCFYT